MVLAFPVLADYCLLEVNGRTLFATHGHLYNEDHLPPLAEGDVLLNGHTHVPHLTPHERYTFVNPGSVSIPKEDSAHSCVLFGEDGEFRFLTLESGTGGYVGEAAFLTGQCPDPLAAAG